MSGPNHFLTLKIIHALERVSEQNMFVTSKDLTVLDRKYKTDVKSLKVESRIALCKTLIS
jgi:hypothetical protein